MRGPATGSILIAALAFHLVSGLVVLESCQRKPRYVPIGADSTGQEAVDSAAIAMREAQEKWESGGGGDDAARLSARIVHAEIGRLAPGEWKARTDALLDSLGIGGETDEGRCMMAVNFFDRSDPNSGSWPYLFWCGPKRPLAQAIEGRGMHLLHALARRVGAKSARDSVAPGAAVLFARRAAAGQQPLLMTWKLDAAGANWKLAQTLGPDSLGGVGTGEFEAKSDTALDLVTRTYRTPPYFEECTTCPHVFAIHRWRWRADGFRRIEDQVVPSPYTSFVQLVQALMTGNAAAAENRVSQTSVLEDAHRYEWGRPKGAWRIAPVTDETPQRLVFFRGQHEAYRVAFEARGSEWVVSGIEPISRSVE